MTSELVRGLGGTPGLMHDHTAGWLLTAGRVPVKRSQTEPSLSSRIHGDAEAVGGVVTSGSGVVSFITKPLLPSTGLASQMTSFSIGATWKQGS